MVKPGVLASTIFKPLQGTLRLPVHSVLDKSGHRPPLQLGFAILRNEPGSPGYFLTSASQFVTTVSELVWAASLLSVRTWNRLPSGRGVSAAQFRVPGLIHVAHASGTQVRRDFVMREFRTDVFRQCGEFYQRGTRRRSITEFCALADVSPGRKNLGTPAIK